MSEKNKRVFDADASSLVLDQVQLRPLHDHEREPEMGQSHRTKGGKSTRQVSAYSREIVLRLIDWMRND